MYALSTIANRDITTHDSEGTSEVRLVFSTPKSEENLRSSTIFENQGSKQSAGGRADTREISPIR
jgi:hypothetical protein